MFSAIYFNIALLYLLVFVVVFLSLYAVLQLPMGIHEEETVYQRGLRFLRESIFPKRSLIQALKEEIVQIKDTQSPRSKSL
jgi:hypothetical protein